MSDPGVPTLENSEQIPQTIQEETQMPSGEPVVRESRTVQTEYLAGHPSPLNKQQKGTPLTDEDLAGIPKKDHAIVKQFSDLADKPEEAAQLKVVIIRKSPALFRQHRFACGKVIKVYDVGSFPDIRSWVVDEFGGGTYEVKLVQPRGDIESGAYAVISKLHFNQDFKTHPPIPDSLTTYGNDGTVTAGAPIKDEIPKGGDSRPTFGDDVVNLQVNKRRVELKNDLEEEEHKGFINRQTRQRQVDDNEDRKWQRGRDRLDSERKSMLELKEASDRDNSRSEDRMIKVFEMIREDKSNGGDGGMGTVMTMFMKMMADSNDKTMMMFKEMSEQRKEDQRKVAESAAKSSDQTLALMTSMNQSSLEQLKDAHAKSEGMLEKVMTMRMDDPNSRLDQYIKASRQGKEEMKEIYEMMEKLRPDDSGDDDFNWDPDAGVAGNVATLAFNGLKRLLSGPTGEKAMGFVNAVMNKPRTNTQFTDSEVAAAAQQLEPYFASGQLPNNARPNLPAPIQNTQGFTTGQVLPGTPRQHAAHPAVMQRPQPGAVYAVQAAPVQTAPVQAAPVQTAPMNPQPMNHPAMRHPQPFVQAPQPVQTVAPPGTVEILPPNAPMPETVPVGEEQETPEDRLRYHLNAVLEEAITDILDQRNVHQWPYTAFESLNGAFLNALAQAPNDTAQFNLIQQYADPELFNRLMNLFWKSGNDQIYFAFRQGMQVLIQMHVEKHNAPATAAPAFAS